MIQLLDRVVAELPRFAYRFTSEVELHRGIAQVLQQAGIAFRHEHVAGPRDRFDFLLPPGIVIEAKTKGSLAQALAQVNRYAAREDVQAVVLVAARFWGDRIADTVLHDKPIRVVKLKGRAF